MQEVYVVKIKNQLTTITLHTLKMDGARFTTPNYPTTQKLVLQ